MDKKNNVNKLNSKKGSSVKLKKVNIKSFIFIICAAISVVGLIFMDDFKSVDSREVLVRRNVPNNKELDKMLEDLNIVEPNYEFGPDLQVGNNPNMLIIHHSASNGQSVEDIHEEHKAKEWDGIGYNFYIRKDGTIYRGRPENTVGAHTIGKNKESLGICLEGNFEVDKLKGKQKESLEKLAEYLSEKYNISKVEGHNDEYDTLCPGKNISIKEIKEYISKR